MFDSTFSTVTRSLGTKQYESTGIYPQTWYEQTIDNCFL